jgi:hypothetical protein
MYKGTGNPVIIATLVQAERPRNHTLISHINNRFSCVISGFCHDVDEICTVLGYYTVMSDGSAPTFQDTISVPSSRVKKSKTIFLIPKGPIPVLQTVQPPIQLLPVALPFGIMWLVCENDNWIPSSAKVNNAREKPSSPLTCHCGMMLKHRDNLSCYIATGASALMNAKGC